MSTALRIAHGKFGRVALLDMDCSLVRHAHPHCHVLLKVEGGDTQFMVGEQLHPLTDACAVLVDGWQPHAYVHDPARPRTLILALYIEPAWLSLFRPSWAASGSSGFFGSPSGAVSAAIRSLSMDLASELMHRPEQHAEHEQLLSKLMIAVIERFSPWQETTTSLRSIKTAVPDRRIRRVAAIMRNDPADGSDMEAVARQAGLSRAHFFRLFQSTIGVPPRVYVNVMRVERAVAAVMNHGSNISDIATQLGFSEAAHFTRFFRNHTGVSPSEFRQVSQMTD